MRRMRRLRSSPMKTLPFLSIATESTKLRRDAAAGPRSPA
jgi:hypothetical protein